ncbi:uncharacterized protein BDZ99DRAFT_519282 [Mytilinidion resinicola]|uniref:Ankyrin n=1 Tax=Mytilinidion resinicola TaxID=574789 RepID=A0A6A6YNW8_9PEZI|nr:uncharacterized protein BDZ99DRAFT_519282 [Mytilinidion resinicola]KAF2810586.1 hypothetical protein BDZ99DRAFT_519282 [Mytilinidion resinicola]
MSLLELPTELHLEVASYLNDKCLKRLIQAHSLLHERLQRQLHKRALSWGSEYSNYVDWRNDGRDLYLRAVLGQAIARKHHNLVEYLLRYDVSGVNEHGDWPVLGWALENASECLINKLLNYAIGLGDKRTMTLDKVTDHLRDYLQRIPSYPRFVYGRDCNHGSTCACQWGANDSVLQVIKNLLELGADPMGGVSSPSRRLDEFNGVMTRKLPLAFYAWNSAILKLLVDAGADIHWESPAMGLYGWISCPENSGFTMLWKACRERLFSPGVARELLRLGADLNCLRFPTIENEDIISLTKDLEVRNDYGKTALQVAIAQGSLSYSRLLIEAGADVTVEDSNGKKLLDLPYKYPVHLGRGHSSPYAMLNWAKEISEEMLRGKYSFRTWERSQFLATYGSEDKNGCYTPEEDKGPVCKGQ